MASFSVILVEPKYEGNVGAVARVMKNFGLSESRETLCVSVRQNCIAILSVADDKGAIFASLDDT